jgi:peptidoglycan/LPS O-acetylase OafA/YrhL
LSFEAAFYVLIPFIALAWSGREPGSRVHVRWYLAAAFVLIVAVAAALPVDRAIFLAYFALFVPGLAIGALAPEERERVAARVPSWLAVAAWIAFTLALKLEVIANTRAVYFAASALACGLLVLKCCDPASPIARIFSTRPALALGRISYSFFLVHYIVVHLVGHLLHPGADAASRAIFVVGVYAGGFALSALAAWALFLAAERFYFVRTR